MLLVIICPYRAALEVRKGPEFFLLEPGSGAVSDCHLRAVWNQCKLQRRWRRRGGAAAALCALTATAVFSALLASIVSFATVPPILIFGIVPPFLAIAPVRVAPTCFLPILAFAPPRASPTCFPLILPRFSPTATAVFGVPIAWVRHDARACEGLDGPNFEP